MTVYEYRAIDEKGQVIQDSVEAASIDAANSTLEGQGYTPIALSPRDAVSDGVTSL